MTVEAGITKLIEDGIAAINKRVYSITAPSSATLPYIVFSLLAGGPETDGNPVKVSYYRFSIYSNSGTTNRSIRNSLCDLFNKKSMRSGGSVIIASSTVISRGVERFDFDTKIYSLIVEIAIKFL